MKITITKEPVTVARLDKLQFEEDMRKDFDLKKAVMDNVEILSCSLPEGYLAKMPEYIFLATDWADLFKKYHLITEEYIELKMHKCYVEGLVTYKPDQIHVAEGSFTLTENVLERDDFMIVTAFNPRVDKHIEYMLGQNLIDYVNFEWKLLLTLD